MMVIGIDPGVKTGLAAWVPEEQRFQEIRTCTIIQALDFCRLAIRDGIKIEIRFEDARQRKWFGRAGREQLQGAGSIKRDCAIWEEFCEQYQIPCRAIAPTKGATKWTADYFKRVTGWTGRTSEHARDAACLVYGA
ncbi:MAG: hypothetical protein SCH71_17005 [Desulfobulbaceae bacterium]|nr:hypothetical protein [Desulfobulbaceae bacterium]